MKRLLVLDSFALLAMFKAEPGGPRVRELLREAENGEINLEMASVNLGEVFYKTIREYGLERGQEILAAIQQLPVEIVSVDQEIALAAAHIKGVHRISYADCIAAALAQKLDAPLLTGDSNFENINELKVEWLPQRA